MHPALRHRSRWGCESDSWKMAFSKRSRSLAYECLRKDLLGELPKPRRNFPGKVGSQSTILPPIPNDNLLPLPQRKGYLLKLQQQMSRVQCAARSTLFMLWRVSGCGSGWSVWILCGRPRLKLLLSCKPFLVTLEKLSLQCKRGIFLKRKINCVLSAFPAFPAWTTFAGGGEKNTIEWLQRRWGQKDFLFLVKTIPSVTSRP